MTPIVNAPEASGRMTAAAPSARLQGAAALILGGGANGPPRPHERHPLGNGRAIGIRLAAEGADIAVADISGEAAEVTATSVRDVGRHAVALEVDASDPDACRSVVDEAHGAFGRLDIVVCNVGIHGRQSFRQQTVADWEHTMAVNARAHWVTAQAALRHMLGAGHGVFVFVASVAAERTSATGLAYEASKAAQLAVMRHLAVRYADRGIRANALALGVIDSGMVRALFSNTAEAEAERDAMAPIGRQGRPEEVAAAAAFLASDDASYITGAVLHVDGGLSAVSPTYRRPLARPRGRSSASGEMRE